MPILLNPSTAYGQATATSPASDDSSDVEVVRDGPYEIYRNDNQEWSTFRRVMELSPQREAQPALSIQLIPNKFHRKNGNAALFYLQAMGLFERSAVQQAKRDFEREQREAVLAEDGNAYNAPPYSWVNAPPNEVPVEALKNYLVYTSFQPRYLAEAAQREECDFDRRIQEVDNPIGYLLPEIQSMRELVRQQSLRFILAVAEDRPHDAVEILGQQLALGSHIGQDHFLVSALVGVACANIGMIDAFYLCEHPDAPNLYWAVAALPNPLVDMRPSLSFERELLFMQFKQLAEVDETPRSDDYWKQFVSDFIPTIQQLEPSIGSLGEVGIALGVPGAKRYLREVVGLDDETLQQLPNTQIFFLAVRRYYERSRDELFKAFYAPGQRAAIFEKSGESLAEDMNEFGIITMPANVLLPAIQAVDSAQRRLQQQLALLQTVESIRHHLATHDDAFPKTLDELELPVPRDPATDQPFEYELTKETAKLTGGVFPGLRYEFVLKVKQ